MYILDVYLLYFIYPLKYKVGSYNSLSLYILNSSYVAFQSDLFTLYFVEKKF